MTTHSLHIPKARLICLLVAIILLLIFTPVVSFATGPTPTATQAKTDVTAYNATPTQGIRANVTPALGAVVSTQAATQPSSKRSDGRVPRIVFVSNRKGSINIYAMDPDRKNIVQLTNTTDFKLFPTWSPNGKLIAYLVGIAAGKPPILMVMHANGSNIHRINLGKALAISPPAWSPDSRQIAYISVRARSAESGLYIVDVAANREQKLKTSVPLDFSYKPPAENIALTDAFAPSWSPDGKTILLFGGLETAEKTTLLVGVDGKTVTPLLTNTKLIATDASWSPDGIKVLFVGLEQTGNYTKVSLHITDLTGVSFTELLPDTSVVPQFPVWSPDGKQIVFVGIDFSNPTPRVYVMNTDGSNKLQLTDESFSQADGWPSWGMVPAELVKHQ